MEGQLGLSELSVILLVFAVEGCPISRVPLYQFSTIINKLQCVITLVDECETYAHYLHPIQNVLPI